jgi:2-polyprenyl-6-methoxyphenol hydroxylase-like FAD-dependent oxidoreductase
MTSATEVVVIGGGQSGLAAARALQARGISPVVLEAGDRAAGSWPCYYDSLKAFSPARFNAMPGMAFPGDPDRYPARDEVADYLDSYAAALGVEIRTGTRVAAVSKDGGEFVVVTADGRRLRAAGIVAASGSFSSPYRPAFPGQESFTGELTHVADYRNPAPYARKRVIADRREGRAPLAALNSASRPSSAAWKPSSPPPYPMQAGTRSNHPATAKNPVPPLPPRDSSRPRPAIEPAGHQRPVIGDPQSGKKEAPQLGDARKCAEMKGGFNRCAQEARRVSRMVS